MEFNNLFLQAATNCPGCFWKILAMLLAAILLGLLLGALLWRRYKTMVQKVEGERDSYHAKLTDTEKDLASLKYQLDEQSKAQASLKSSLNKCEADKATLEFRLNKAMESGDGKDLGTAGIVAAGGLDTGGGDDLSYGAIFSSDNLQIIEGIGPKIEQLLKDADVNTWSALAGAGYDRLKGILDEAGPRYRMHDPQSWSDQAQLAADGKWDELITYQKSLDGGKEGTGMPSPSKVEKLYSKALGFSSVKPDDLKIVEGIGPKIEGLLKDAGIKNWSDLSGASVERLQEVLDSAGENYRLANPETWPKQAQLASDAKWTELKEYQDFLQGGKDPG